MLLDRQMKWTYVTLDHKTSSTDIFVAIANNTLYGSKLLFFSSMPKIIWILCTDHVPEDDFQMYRFFLHPQIRNFKIVVSWPNIVVINHTSMESFKLIYSAFRWRIHFNKKKILMNGFVVHGHILEWFLKNHVTLSNWSNDC